MLLASGTRSPRSPQLATTPGPAVNGVVPAAVAAQLAQQQGISLQQLALNLVGAATSYARAPISGFQVGAVAIGGSGALYYGANLEVVGEALSFTLHAEQAAISNAWINGEQGVLTLAISAAPCGYCRQFLYELVDAATLQVQLPNTAAQLLTYYLPDPFGPHDLGVEGGLMQPQFNNLTVAQDLDPCATAALAAANASYSPYTFTYAGVALQTMDGTICTGRYAENAAYNPSLSPLEGALSQLVLHGQEYGEVVEAVLVQNGGGADQTDATKNVLLSITQVPLTSYYAF